LLESVLLKLTVSCLSLLFIKMSLCLVFTKTSQNSFFSEKSHFYVQNDRNHQKFGAKKSYLIKSYSVSERANFGLSSHAFISISTFFEWGGGLKTRNELTIYTLLENLERF